jgi:hypothetical protein
LPELPVLPETGLPLPTPLSQQTCAPLAEVPQTVAAWAGAGASRKVAPASRTVTPARRVCEMVTMFPQNCGRGAALN